MPRVYVSFFFTPKLWLTLTKAYGEEGVVKAVEILEREITTGMRLLGAKNVSELVPEMVCICVHIDLPSLTSN